MRFPWWQRKDLIHDVRTSLPHPACAAGDNGDDGAGDPFIGLLRRPDSDAHHKRGARAAESYINFFAAEIENGHTRRAYLQVVRQFDA
jgi:hypothetical protein